MLRGETKYPPTQGTLELRQAIIDTTRYHSSTTQSIDNIIVSTGAKQVLANALLSSVNEGDEIILPAPFWTSYADIIGFCEAVPVMVTCKVENDFKIIPEDLLAAITPKTKWLMLNSPNNPSGALYSHNEIAALARILNKHPHVWLLVDEIYQHISYNEFRSFLEVAPDLAERMLVVNGVSKAYAMTGWRLGWGIGPKSLIKAMVGIQGLTTSGASSISQAAALAALTGPQDILKQRLKSFIERRNFVVKALNKTGILECKNPGGSFYIFPSCSKTFGKVTPQGHIITTDADFCNYILEQAKVALVPGRAFGLPGYFRLSYAYSMSELQKGCSRISDAVAALK
jgi:aspartate aminotransferase